MLDMNNSTLSSIMLPISSISQTIPVNIKRNSVNNYLLGEVKEVTQQEVNEMLKQNICINCERCVYVYKQNKILKICYRIYWDTTEHIKTFCNTFLTTEDSDIE
jgi:ferredoxin